MGFASPLPSPHPDLGGLHCSPASGTLAAHSEGSTRMLKVFLALLAALLTSTSTLATGVEYRVLVPPASTTAPGYPNWSESTAWTAGGGGGADLTIDISAAVATSSDIIVQIANPVSPPLATDTNADLGMVHIRGGTALPIRVRVLIADHSFTPTVDHGISTGTDGTIDDRNQLWTAGVRTWTGGIAVEHSTTGLPYPELREVVRLNANLLRSFEGTAPNVNTSESIDVGSVIRLFTDGVPINVNDSQAGWILGFIRGRNNYTPIGQTVNDTRNAIGLIWAKDKIEATIVAGDADMSVGGTEGTDSTLGTVGDRANVGTVRVGPNLYHDPSSGDDINVTTGLFADIAARRGVVREVLATGPIHAASQHGQGWGIEAGNGVWVVRTAEDETGGLFGSINGADITTRIRANLDVPGDKSVGKGAIRVVETPSYFDGSIVANNVCWNAPSDTPANIGYVPGFVHKGILVGGYFNGSIYIRYNLERADIVASRIKGNVHVGHSVRGSIVAYGDGGENTTPGEIGGSVEIGFPNLTLDPLMPSYYDQYPRGMRGSGAPPVDMSRYGPFEAGTWLDPRRSDDPTAALMEYDGGSMDCVLRVYNVQGDLRVYAMQQYNEQAQDEKSSDGVQFTQYWPRVELPAVANPAVNINFEIGDRANSAGGIESGVVWSGRLEYSGVGNVANDETNDYAWIDSGPGFGGPSRCWINTVSSGGGVWARKIRSLVVETDMNGLIRTDHLEKENVIPGPPFTSDASTIVIGERFGDITDITHQMLYHFWLPPNGSGEVSPRGAPSWSGFPLAFGRIDIFGANPADLKELRGQVVIDRYNPSDVQRPATHCKGEVRVGYPASPFLVTVTGQSPAASYGLPRYDTLSNELGFSTPADDDFNGGAVGLAPYALHAADSAPPNNRAWSLTAIPAASAIPFVTATRWFEGAADLRLRFYGPVFGDPAQYGVRVERSPNGTFGSDRVDATGLFGVLAEVSHNPALDRDVWLSPVCNTKYPAGYYRVVRTQDSVDAAALDRLYSDLTYSPTLSHNNYVAPFAFYFRLCDCGKADLGRAGGLVGADCQLDNNDFVAFITLFFANDPLADMGVAGGLPGSDGLWDNNDFIAFINAFFQGCTPNGDAVRYECGERPGPGMRMALEGGAEQADGPVSEQERAQQAAFDAQRRAGVQASARQALASLVQGLSPSQRAPFAAVLDSGQPITQELMLQALEAVFNAAAAPDHR
ncbi:MAG: hypothetical protein K2Q09_07960 [Phycisphaerales bacterium]|nr:hypothetical protein [Phycisphaerales bacterium]